MNYGIWAAVSTEAQAGDRASLPVQVEACRHVASQRGWNETAGPYIVPGASRTRYVNLRDAESEIPQLRQMLDDAQAGRFQVLLLYDYNRLRDLADPIARALAAYGVQLYSVNQPVEPSDMTDGESIMRGMSGIISRWQINDLRRKYAYGMAARVSRGLHALHIPWGYYTPDRQIPAIPEPGKAALLVRLKDAYLAGATLDEVTQMANASGLKPTRGGKWDRSIITEMLRNPYYAGFVTWRRTRLVADPRTGKRKQVDNPQVTVLPGRQPAIWSEADHRRILAEFSIRSPVRSVYPFTGLLTCHACEAVLWIQLGETRRDGSVGMWWRCPTVASPRHLRLSPERAAVLVADALRIALSSYDGEVQAAEVKPPDGSKIVEKRERIEAAYEAGLYSLEQFREKVGQVDAELRLIQDEQRRERERREQAKLRGEVLAALSGFPALDRWLLEDEPRTVNHALRLLCTAIVISPDAARLVFR